MTNILPSERIERSILLIRGHKVMLDADLAVLYGVTVGRLNEAVKRNRDRFPDDFMFQLSPAEFHNLKLQIGDPNLKSQIAISSSNWGGRCLYGTGGSHAFWRIESKRAAKFAVNIEIMRAFVRLRQLLSTEISDGTAMNFAQVVNSMFREFSKRRSITCMGLRGKTKRLGHSIMEWKV